MPRPVALKVQLLNDWFAPQSVGCTPPAPQGGFRHTCCHRWCFVIAGSFSDRVSLHRFPVRASKVSHPQAIQIVKPWPQHPTALQAVAKAGQHSGMHRRLWIIPPRECPLKRPTIELWERQARLARYRAAEKRSRAHRHRAGTGERYVPPGEVIKAPRRIDVTRGSGMELGKFLRAIETSVLVQQQPTRLDFRFTDSFYPAGAIRLLAEIDRLVTLSPLPKPITIIDPRVRRPREVMKQIGLYEITGDKCDLVPQLHDVVYWRATKGKDQSGETPGRLLEVVAERVNSEHAKQLELSGVWRGLSEAVANSVDHAYRNPRSDGFTGLPETKWWMFTQLRDGMFTMAVCDLGCGYQATISETLPEKFRAVFSEAFGLGNRDCMAIDAAMEYGRSGTKQDERGKGSRDARSVVERHGAGELVILSNTGWMKYTYSPTRGWSSTRQDLGIDIKGTIVWWKLPLKEV